jgi:alpha-L-fucosidase
MIAFLLGAVMSVNTAIDLSAFDAKPDEFKWWKEARFGMFVHWGPVSLQGTEIGWSRGGERRGVGGTGEVPLDVYDNLYKKFNPTKFDANKWVAIAKAAGMKYMVFTSRHHDGFSNFDSKYSDYKITSPLSPYRKDIVKQLADACHKAGMRFGIYYSQPDWHNADYMTATHAKYVEYMHNQVAELLSNYGKVDEFWFDGLQGNADTFRADTLFPMMRKLQPHMLINNRCGWKADFDTPEQRIGGFQKDRPWESCFTICNQWAWKPNDSMKSLKECIQTLVTCAGGDGNLLFNVGPMPTGEIEPRQVERLKEMGAWLKKYGSTVYGTRGGPFLPGAWGAATTKGNKVWLHLFMTEPGTIELGPIDAKMVSVRPVCVKKAHVYQNPEGITVEATPLDKKPIDTIIEIAFDKPVDTLGPIRLFGSGSRASSATASNVFEKLPQYQAMKAFDGDPNTRWATDGGTPEAQIEWTTKEPVTAKGLRLFEEYGQRIEGWILDAWIGGAWKTVVKGKKSGLGVLIPVEATSSDRWRLLVTKANAGPTLSEIVLVK